MMTTEATFGSGTFGNEFALDNVYGDLVLTAELQPFRERVAHLFHAFPHLKEEYGERVEETVGRLGQEDEEESEESEGSEEANSYGSYY